MTVSFHKAMRYSDTVTQGYGNTVIRRSTPPLQIGFNRQVAATTKSATSQQPAQSPLAVAVTVTVARRRRSSMVKHGNVRNRPIFQ